MTFAVIVEDDHLTEVEWKNGGVLVSGGSPNAASWLKKLEGDFSFPKARRAEPSRTVQPEIVTRPARNEFELMQAVLNMARERDLTVEIIEE